MQNGHEYVQTETDGETDGRYSNLRWRLIKQSHSDTHTHTHAVEKAFDNVGNTRSDSWKRNGTVGWLGRYRERQRQREKQKRCVCCCHWIWVKVCVGFN